MVGPGSAWLRRRRIPLLVAAIGITSLLLLLPIFGLAGTFYHAACSIEGVAARESLWTPVALLNSPSHGYAAATAVRLGSGGSLPVPGLGSSISAANGSSIGVFSLNQWTLYALRSGYVAGPGPSSPCTAAYLPSLAQTPLLLPNDSLLLPVSLLGTGNTTDQGEAGSIEAFGFPSVQFAIGFQSAGSTYIGTCSPEGTSDTAVYGHIIVQVPEEVGGVLLGYAQASILDAATYTYQFPPGGTWEIDPDTSVGLSFAFSGCPPPST